MQLPMPQQPAVGAMASEQQQSHHQVDQENHAANALLRERFLHFLASLPGQQANVKMFGADVSGTVLGVDARGFEHLLMADLRTPTGPVDRAALRTRDCLFLQVPWPSAVGSDNGDKGQVEVESAGIADEEAEDKELPDLLPDIGGCEMEMEEENTAAAAESGETQNSVVGDGDFDRIGDAGGRRGSGSGASTPNTIRSGSSKRSRMSVASRMLRSSAVTAIHFPSADHFFGQFSGAGGK